MSEGAAKKEEKPRKFQAIRGVRDILPPETALWTRVEQTAHEVFSTYNFGEVRLPIFEETELFARSIGLETDVVNKEMYIFDLHGSYELELWRDMILGKYEKNPTPLQADREFAEFVRQLEINLASDRLQGTQENMLLVDRIKQAVARFHGLYERTQALGGNDPYLWTDEQSMLAEEIDSWATSLRVGLYAALRPEATASVCRAYIEHNMQQLPQPVKLYTMGPMFRRERPQKGRYRQFYQIDAEVLETVRPDAAKDTAKELAKDAAIDAEVIEMLMTFFDKVGLQGTTLYINSIGHNAPNCRRGYVEKLRAALIKIKDKLGTDSQRRIDTNPLRVLDSKLQHEQTFIEKLPRIADHLCDDCKAHYAAAKRELDLRGVKYQENWRLVRGLDYYMRTTFEITAPGLGSQNAVCGGGRYDGLVELLGGPPTKGIGFAIGEDRLILALQEWRVASEKPQTKVYIAWMGEKAYVTAIRAAKMLRNAGFRAELPPIEQKFGKALGQADKLGAQYALILGENEVQSGQWTLKTLSSGEQTNLSEADLLQFLLKQEPAK